MLWQLKEQKVQTGDTAVDCISFGRGARPLVMIQGLNTRGVKGAGAGLAWMYRLIARDFRVYLFDRRPDVCEGITIRDLAGDVACAMDALGIQNADVLGVSQGGMIAQYLAIERPDLVRRLVLAVTLCRPNAAVTEAITKWIQLANEGKMKALVTDMAQRMYSDRYLRIYKPLLPLLTLVQTPKDVPRFTALAASCLTCDTWEQLEDIRCPVMVIGGKQDKLVTAEASVEMAQKLGCSLYLYEVLGHAAYEEAAKDFNRRVYDFFIS